MSEQRNNFIIAGASIVIGFALVAWHSNSDEQQIDEVVVENEIQTIQTEENAILVNNTETLEETTEEIIVVADELVEKAQEAAERNQTNTTAAE
ncbi:MAG: hypothetical protein CMA72_09725 [Euryarchaeota archaeon]|nr:hypothetical protein [Euryarchaeota archaeon]|tara:strand:- start:4105 stop:4386 length:282 start_codon:yes stop_codon:yes gene_type:complete